VVRGTFSQARAWRPALVARLARTLCVALPAAFEKQPARGWGNPLESRTLWHPLACKGFLPRRGSLVCPLAIAVRRPSSGAFLTPRSTGGRRPSASPAGSASGAFPLAYAVHSAGLRITCRSTGAPTAGHQPPAGGTRYIFPGRGLVACRRRPVSSTLGSTKTAFQCANKECGFAVNLNSHDWDHAVTFFLRDCRAEHARGTWHYIVENTRTHGVRASTRTVTSADAGAGSGTRTPAGARAR
jgi:hypothetical protein